MADHVHLWTRFERPGRQLSVYGSADSPTHAALELEATRDCIVCGKLQTWGESLDDREPGMWWNPATGRLEDVPIGDVYRRQLQHEGWSCETHGHLRTGRSERCLMCGAIASIAPG